MIIVPIIGIAVQDIINKQCQQNIACCQSSPSTTASTSGYHAPHHKLTGTGRRPHRPWSSLHCPRLPRLSCFRASLCLGLATLLNGIVCGRTLDLVLGFRARETSWTDRVRGTWWRVAPRRKTVLFVSTAFRAFAGAFGRWSRCIET